jgi:hypothetical protein
LYRKKASINYRKRVRRHQKRGEIPSRRFKFHEASQKTRLEGLRSGDWDLKRFCVWRGESIESMEGIERVDDGRKAKSNLIRTFRDLLAIDEWIGMWRISMKVS